MKSEDAHLLDQITNALNNLRTQGGPLGVDIRQVVMTIHANPPQLNTVIYAWNDQNADWDITAE